MTIHSRLSRNIVLGAIALALALLAGRRVRRRRHHWTRRARIACRHAAS
jgi:hypothetical protein